MGSTERIKKKRMNSLFIALYRHSHQDGDCDEDESMVIRFCMFPNISLRVYKIQILSL